MNHNRHYTRLALETLACAAVGLAIAMVFALNV